MTMPMRLKFMLDQSKIHYSLVSHVPTYGAQYAAAVMHVPGKDVAKAVVVRSGDQDLLAVLPSSYHINLKKLGGLVGEPVWLIGEQECNKMFPDCEPGAIPPFGELYGLPVYLDESLSNEPELFFSVGSRSDSVRMSCADFVRLVKPHIGSFADAPKHPGDGRHS